MRSLFRKKKISWDDCPVTGKDLRESNKQYWELRTRLASLEDYLNLEYVIEESTDDCPWAVYQMIKKHLHRKKKMKKE